jgi:aryl-alcohol dehydrogenase-like predicted oxidoreductase
MMFGRIGEPDHGKSVEVIHRALDGGINFIDTADMYSQGESEVIVAKALAGGRRDDVVLATKFYWPMGETGDPNRRGGSRRWIFRAVEDSLRRLGTDWIDLYQIHRPDPLTDLEETMSALTDLRAQGKIRAFGGSGFPAYGIVDAQWMSERRALGRFLTEQPQYSMLARQAEAEILPITERFGMGVLCWSPLEGGWLSGQYRLGQPMPESHRSYRIPDRYDLTRPENQVKLAAADALAGLAGEAGLSLIHLALAFVLRHPGVTAPIIGPRTLAHLESQLGAMDIVLSDDLMDEIDAIVPPGTSVTSFDAGSTPSALTDPFLRRRRIA